MNNPQKALGFTLLAILLPAIGFGQIRLPKLISDGMVIQRHASPQIWGWADEAESVSVVFRDSTYKTMTDETGQWKVSLSNMEAGGPYKMTIMASDTLILTDIMVGEVWVSSGQSNMELPIRRVSPIYETEIANATNDAIRYFDVPQSYNFKAAQQVLGSGSWVKPTPQSVLNFSAAAYFFADELNKKYDVPVGIINASVGGSPAESWISEDALKGSFSSYYEETQRFKDDDRIKEIQQEDQQRIGNWYSTLQQKDKGYSNSEKPWYDPMVNTSGWNTMQVPGYWADTKLGDVNGVVWFRKDINVPVEMTDRPVKLLMGRIVDADSVFVNGTFVGTTGYQYPPRRYEIPKGILKQGTNTITVRVINERGNGGFVFDKPYKLVAGDETIDLKGQWNYHLGTTMDPLQGQTFIRWKPVGLYNAMIAPLQNYVIQGVIWYQGESNTGKPDQYKELFSLLIKDWRDKWNQNNFPFLYVQLANFMKATAQPSASNWALLRDSQRKTLELPNTGMAVTIDIGEWNDIHPLNKKEVGHRLALLAEKIAFGEDQIVYSGPLYESMKVEEDKVILTFKNVGNGLVAKGGDTLKEFAIAGPNRQFVWADATIKNNKVVVWSDQISNPKAVRYGWANNPDKANLYNEEGLPASPFRTDDWSATE